jgi:septum formation topological specificity factor MinE
MEQSLGDLSLVLAHERKVRQAVWVLELVRDQVLAAMADAVDSSDALQREASQTEHRSRQLIGEAIRLTATAERLVAEARAIHGERAVLTL